MKSAWGTERPDTLDTPEHKEAIINERFDKAKEKLAKMREEQLKKRRGEDPRERWALVKPEPLPSLEEMRKAAGVVMVPASRPTSQPRGAEGPSPSLSPARVRRDAPMSVESLEDAPPANARASQSHVSSRNASPEKRSTVPSRLRTTSGPGDLPPRSRSATPPLAPPPPPPPKNIPGISAIEKVLSKLANRIDALEGLMSRIDDDDDEDESSEGSVASVDEAKAARMKAMEDALVAQLDREMRETTLDKSK